MTSFSTENSTLNRTKSSHTSQPSAEEDEIFNILNPLHTRDKLTFIQFSN